MKRLERFAIVLALVVLSAYPAVLLVALAAAGLFTFYIRGAGYDTEGTRQGAAHGWFYRI